MSNFFDSFKESASNAFNTVAQEVKAATAGPSGTGGTPELQYIRVNRNEYEVLEKHGEGGFSYVYKVADASGKLFALKRMLLVDRKAREGAEREVSFLERIPRHRAIVELVDSQIDNKEALLVFEFCGGGSVYHLIERRLEQRRPLREEEIWAIYHAACEAVEHLHYQNPSVVHRDLKVENLLLAKRGVVLCDFGSATTHVWNPRDAKQRRLAEDDINTNTTMSYRAPEMADLYGGHVITEKSDIWALGVLLYRLAYFEPPWDTDSSLAILNCKYRIPHQRYSPALPALIKALLVLDPSRRPDIYGILDGVLKVRGKTMSASMQRRRDEYRSRPRPDHRTAAAAPAASSSSAAPAAASGSRQQKAVAVDGGFVAASLFDSLDWQDAGNAPVHQQHQPAPQQQQQQQQQPSLFFGNDLQQPPQQQQQPLFGSSSGSGFGQPSFPSSGGFQEPLPRPPSRQLTPQPGSNSGLSPAAERLLLSGSNNSFEPSFSPSPSLEHQQQQPQQQQQQFGNFVAPSNQQPFFADFPPVQPQPQQPPQQQQQQQQQQMFPTLHQMPQQHQQAPPGNYRY